MSAKSRQATRSRHQMRAVLEPLGVTRGQFEDMVATIEREGYFDLGPNQEDSIVTIDRDYSFHELCIEGLDDDDGG